MMPAEQVLSAALTAAAAAASAWEIFLFLSPLTGVSRKRTLIGFALGAAFLAVFAYMGRQISYLLPAEVSPLAGLIPLAASLGRAVKTAAKKTGFEMADEIKSGNLAQLAAALTVWHGVCPLSVSLVPGALDLMSAAVSAAAAAITAALLGYLPVSGGTRTRRAAYLLTALCVGLCGAFSLISAYNDFI